MAEPRGKLAESRAEEQLGRELYETIGSQASAVRLSPQMLSWMLMTQIRYNKYCSCFGTM